MTEIEIRRATADDDRTLAELDRRTWAPEGAITPPPRTDMPFFDIEHPPDQFFVALRGDRVIGFVRLVQPVPLPSNAHVRQIQGLAVDPPERGQGIGRRLIDTACAEARRQGARRITLRVLSTNSGALRLYSAAGFAVEGVLPGEFHIAGEYVDDILMGRRLD